MTEKLLIGTLSLNTNKQTNKQKKFLRLEWIAYNDATIIHVVTTVSRDFTILIICTSPFQILGVSSVVFIYFLFCLEIRVSK